MRDLRAGTILRAEDGTRAIAIRDGYRWRVEPPGGTDADARVVEPAEIAGRPWQVEAYGPGYKAHSEVVYLDLDGTRRKVYRATASKYEIERYEKAAKVYQKARDAGQDAKAPDSPALYYVEHAGVRYTLAPTTWYGVSDAVSWYVVGAPEASRRAKAAQTADRRTLTPDAARALAAMVLSVLPEVTPGYSTYALTVTDIRRDMQENRRDMFVPLRDDAAYEAYPWRVAFPANDADTALLSDAADRYAVAERLIGAAVRRLVADGWAAESSRARGGRGEYVTGYVRGERALPPARVGALTRWDGPRDRADKARSAAEARLRARSRSDYAWLSDPAYARLRDAEAAVRAAHGAAAHPFATEADVTAFAAAIARLHAEADAVSAANE